MVWRPVTAILTLALCGTAQAQGKASADEAHRQFVLGTRLEAQRQLEKAARAYEEAIHLDPRMAAAHDRLGFVYGLLGRTAEAVARFELAREIDPDLFDAHYHLGATLWWTGENER